jgi:hypothetical protein
MKSRTLLVLVILLVVGSISATYYRTFIVKDYLVEFHAPCDPATESCYLEECWEEPCEPVYYKLMTKSAGTVFAQCGKDVSECDFYACEQGETDCSFSECDPESEECAEQAVAEPSINDIMPADPYPPVEATEATSTEI